MTEKRFTLIDGFKKGTHTGIWDNQKQNNQRIGDELWLGEVVGMLNEGVMIAKENEQLKKDATTLVYANQDYRQQNQNLQKQLNYIQNSINNAIKHQKTELGQKALQEIIADYNEWMLGHKEVKE